MIKTIELPEAARQSDGLENRLSTLMNAANAGRIQGNVAAAARAIEAMAWMYDLDEDEIENMIRDMLTDMRHACDLLGIDFARQDRIARDNYQAELGREGVCPDISEGWP
ncbi:MAG: hypothetical protein KI788_06310 [Mameliella sp.]|nr:hypothetical protein [Mameliella sp.]